MIKINKHLGIFVGLFVFLGVISLFVFQKLSPLLTHATYYCKTLIQTNMTQIPYYLSIIPAGIVFLILMISFLKFLFLALKICFLQYRLKATIVGKSDINMLIENLGLAEKTVIVKSRKRFAFCLGIKNPKIYLSSTLVAKLSLKEIESVLRHEQYHLENHDTFTMIVASVTQSLIPFFPLFGDFIKKYRVKREIEADNFAIEKVGGSESLISALRKLLAFSTVGSANYAAIADHDTLEPRIYSLVNKPYRKRQFRLKNLFVTLLSSFAILAVMVLPVNAMEIHHEEHDVILFSESGAVASSCTSEKNLDKFYSEIPSDKNIYSSNSSQLYSPAHH